jgi:hypothetical protein
MLKPNSRLFFYEKITEEKDAKVPIERGKLGQPIQKVSKFRMLIKQNEVDVERDNC